MSKNISLANKIQQQVNAKQVFVYYRKVGEKLGKSLVQKDASLYFTRDYKDSGFVMAGFDDAKKTVLIPYNKAIAGTFEYSEKKLELPVGSNLTLNISKNNKENHIQLVQETIDFIKARKAQKVVVSQIQEQKIDTNRIGEIFLNLLQTYPNAMVYIWHHPKVGLWMGATPEKLVNVTYNNYVTMALAGTQIYKENCTWKAKEKQEQQFVTDYVEKQLVSISKNINIGNSYTTKAGHLAHIRTDIKGELLENVSLKKLLTQLHPTPAVCGTPRAIAKDFILKNEGYDRSFYTGFLGELNLDFKSDLYVNLRCMQIQNDKAFLYVGGGITKDSNPISEWNEVQYKARVIGNILR